MAAPFDLLIRHVAEDAVRAAPVAEALRAFGYKVSLGDTPVGPDYDVRAKAVLFLWSARSIYDDALMLDAVRCVAADKADKRPSRVYEINVDLLECRLQVRDSDDRTPNRLYSFDKTDLSSWTGTANDERLAPLIWELLPPTQIWLRPPFRKPADRDEALWRATLAIATPDAFAAYFSNHLTWGNDRLNKASALGDRLATAREALADPQLWASFGPDVMDAVTRLPADNGAALHALGIRLGETGVFGTQRIKWIRRQYFQTLVQICAPERRPHLGLRETRTIENLENGVATGDPEAMVALADEIVRDEDENRGLQLFQRAAEAGYLPAFWNLYVFLSFDKPRKATSWARWGSERGCMKCRASLASDIEDCYRPPGRKEAFALRASIPEKQRAHEDTLYVARALWDGKIAPRDRAEAKRLFFEIALADGGNLHAAIHIGDLYRFGRGGFSADLCEAQAWYKSVLMADWTETRIAAKERLLATGAEVAPLSDDELEERNDAFWTPSA